MSGASIDRSRGPAAELFPYAVFLLTVTALLCVGGPNSFGKSPRCRRPLAVFL